MGKDEMRKELAALSFSEKIKDFRKVEGSEFGVCRQRAPLKER
jgi:hypothetical protein